MPSFRFRRFRSRRSRGFRRFRPRFRLSSLRSVRLRRFRRRYPRNSRKYVRLGVSPELKHFGSDAMSTTSTTAWSGFFLNPIAQGQTSTTRVGATAKMKRIFFRMNFYNGIAAAAQQSITFRFILGFCPTHVANGGLVITNVLDSTAGVSNMTSLRNLQNTHEFIVLRDVTLSVAPDQNNKPIQMNIPLNFLTRWNNVAPAQEADYDYGMLWCFFGGNITSASAGVVWSARLDYYDA